jgi:nitrate reductase gamma subunit
MFFALGTVVFFWNRIFLSTAKDISSTVNSFEYLLICAYVEATIPVRCSQISAIGFYFAYSGSE